MNVIKGDDNILLGILYNILQIHPNIFLKSEEFESLNIFGPVFLDKELWPCTLLFLFSSAVLYLSRRL